MLVPIRAVYERPKKKGEPGRFVEMTYADVPRHALAERYAGMAIDQHPEARAEIEQMLDGLKQAEEH